MNELELTRDFSSAFSLCVQVSAHSSYSGGCQLKLSWLYCALNFHYFIEKSKPEAFSSASLDI